MKVWLVEFDDYEETPCGVLSDPSHLAAFVQSIRPGEWGEAREDKEDGWWRIDGTDLHGFTAAYVAWPMDVFGG